MATRSNGFAGMLGKLNFLKGSIILVTVWPIVCLILGILLWVTLFSKLEADRNALEQNALKEAAALSDSYAQHLTRTIEQVDQITLLVKYEWEHSHRALKLEDLSQKGAFPIAQFTLVLVIDRNGEPITGTLPFEAPPNVLDRDYFIFHQNDKSQALRIGKPAVGRISKKTVIQFTRRLETADGTFDGVVLVSAEPAYFASFYNNSSLGKEGFLAVAGKDGALRMATIGAATKQTASTLRTTPAFDTLSDSGSWHGAQWFADNRTRFVAWQALKPYPLIALVGLSEEERLASYHKNQGTYRHIAITGSISLFLFAFIATLLSARLAWRKHQEAEVQNAYRIASEGGNDGFYMLRALRDKRGTVVDFEVVDCNARGAAFYGLTKEQFVGEKSSRLNTPSHLPVVLKTYCRALESGFYEDEIKIPSDSPIKLEWVHRRLVRSGTGLAITFRDISAIKAHERELSRMANEDALTALPNRNWLMHFLPGELERAKQTNNMLALLFVDLDNFKNVNDSFGHSAGDELLHAAALRLKSVLRPTDHVLRLGGDEFTVILQPILSASEASSVAGRITDAFNQPFDLARSKNVVGASIGICLFPRDGEDTETLLKHSDIAMYHAKAQGKGHFRFYEPSLSENLKTRLDTERALQQAIEQDQFVLFYQPRICAFTGELRALEALVRWKHPERGLVPPLEFIPLAEETGLILKLGELVLEQACAQIAHWKTLNLPLVPVSINVSPYQFNHGDIKNNFAACLARHQLDPELVEIEITESSMMGEQEDVCAELSAIRALGIKLLVDDFGTGYSSLSQLQRLDMDILKVDRAFTSELCKTTEGEVFFLAIVSMAHALGMSVVAEGVETDAQLRVLQTLSCDEIQGYFISRPVPAGEVPGLMQKRFLLPNQLAMALPGR